MRVVAIDGPAGSGKSTVARALAQRLELAYLDTGAMYRAVAFQALRCGIDPDETEPVAKLARGLDLHVEDQRVVVDGVDASIEIRGPEVTRAASVVAANPEVRAELRRRQRQWAEDRGGGVVEGRDMGSVVFPDASMKVYLTADPEVRAERRHREVSEMAYEEVAAEMARRDARDRGRAHDPLVAVGDAVEVDTTGRGVEEIVDELVRLLGEREGA